MKNAIILQVFGHLIMLALDENSVMHSLHDALHKTSKVTKAIKIYPLGALLVENCKAIQSAVVEIFLSGAKW